MDETPHPPDAAEGAGDDRRPGGAGSDGRAGRAGSDGRNGKDDRNERGAKEARDPKGDKEDKGDRDAKQGKEGKDDKNAGDGPTDEKDSAAPATGDVDDEWDERAERDLDHVRRVFHSVTHNHFHADVDATDATFGNAGGGPGGRAPIRRATGVLRCVDVDAELRGFVEPPMFHAALATLRERHLTVMVGEDGCGRRTAALALVRRAASDGEAITSLSPAMTFGELAAKKSFRRGRGYLVQDHIGDGEVPAVREFECPRLAERLRGDGAYLVVTATPVVVPPRTLRQFAHEWRGPDLLAVFDAAVAGFDLADEVLEAARGRAGLLRSPQEAVSFVRRLAVDPANAIDALGHSAREQVSAWFDAKPGKREVLAIAALAFLHCVPERVFEGRLAMLLALAGDEREPTDELPQQRVTIARGHPLVTVQRVSMIGESGTVTERVVVFHSARHRGHVIDELCERYGYELWEPLREWLHDIARDAGPGARVELALGMAQLARTSFGEVADFLDRWAGGLAPERLTAAVTLWGMCAGDGLAPLALQTAMRWVSNRGQQRAITAAVALGGELGLLYQSDALRWLWFLARRGQNVSNVAVFSLAGLFASGVDDRATCLAMLNQARNEFGDAVAGAEDDPNGVRAVRRTVVALLGVPRLDDGRPAVATVVREHPAAVAALGALWADVLCSAPHRRGAFDALVACLAAMADDPAPDSHEQLGRLGTAVLAAMPPQQREVLWRDLRHAAADDRATTRPPDELVRALLVALDDPQTKETR